MSNVQYICLLGKARTGKTTMAEMIVRALTAAGFTAEIFNLADTLKTLCPQLPGESKEDWRPRLISFGAFSRGRFGNGYLGRKVVMRCAEFRDDLQFAVVPDVRIKEEYEWFATAHNATGPTVFFRLDCTDGTWAQRFDSEEAYLKYMTKAAADDTETGLPELNAIDVINNADGAGKMQVLKLIYDAFIKQEEVTPDAAKPRLDAGCAPRTVDPAHGSESTGASSAA